MERGRREEGIKGLLVHGNHADMST
jgi:hypothetical protein